jgi:hypothetical protein
LLTQSQLAHRKTSRIDPFALRSITSLSENK